MRDLERRPRRLDCASSYPRLVSGGAGGTEEPLEAAAWRAQTELILDAAGEGIYGLDLQGRCTFVNPAAAQMTGHTVEELLGESMHEVVHHSHEHGARYVRGECPIYAAFADGLIRNVCDEVFWRKDGTAFPVEYTSTPIFNGADLVGAVVVFRDIAIRRETERRLRSALSEVQRLKEQLQRENLSLRREIATARGAHEIVGNSAAVGHMLRLLARVADTESTVLVQGETGTGKELVARSLHRLSSRRDAPLVRLNCGALNTALADSELFGHERGAFTGALQRRAGRFEQAHGGTLFLDEIGELPLETQSKLLRVLQEHEFERVGGNETLRAEARVVAATNRDLKAMVRAGTFRADLYFRLSVLPITVPALRDRLSDVPALADHFLKRLEARLGRELGRVDEAGIRRLTGYHWPGNVRELQNVVEHAAIMSDGPVVGIPESNFAFRDGLLDAPMGAAAADVAPGLLRDTPRLPASATSTLDDVEREHILAVLEQTRWRLSGPAGASRILGLHPNTLRHRMAKLGIHR